MLRGASDENEVVTFGFFDGTLEELDQSQRESDMRRLVGSLHVTPEPPPDPATRDALLRAYRDLRGG